MYLTFWITDEKWLQSFNTDFKDAINHALLLHKNENKRTEYSGKEIINRSKPMEGWRKGMMKTNTRY